MGVMTRFESLMQGIVEGSFGKIFRSRLQPVELSNKLVRAMEANLQLGPERRLAPNVYTVHLSERDFEYFTKFQESLKRQLSSSLVNVARERGYMLTSMPFIEFKREPTLGTGETHIEALVVDARNGANDPNGQIDETRSMSPQEAQLLVAQAQAAQRAAEPMPPAWLTLYRPSRGNPMPLGNPVIHIGRHLTNDVVVNDKRVSRHHAEIRYEHGQFVLYDLGSTNGVGINGVMTHQPVPLKNNDIVTVGSHEFVFQRR